MPDPRLATKPLRLRGSRDPSDLTLALYSQACAVESVAVHHHDHQVHLALTSTHVGGTDSIIQALAAYHNIRISTLDVDDVLGSSGRLGKWLREMEWARGTGEGLRPVDEGFCVHRERMEMKYW